MTRRRKTTLAFALLAAIVGTIFFAIAVDGDLYAPGAMAVHYKYQHDFESARQHVPTRFRHDVNAIWVIHKSYSVIAFAVIGVLISPLVGSHRRVLWCALGVGAFSTAIEIGQKLSGVRESLLSNFFDIGCGVAGGIIGAVAWNVATNVARRASQR